MSIETIVTWLLWNKWPVLAFALGFLLGRRKTYNYNIKGGEHPTRGLAGFLLIVAVGVFLLGGFEFYDLLARFR